MIKGKILTVFKITLLTFFLIFPPQIHMHGSSFMQSLCEVFPPSILPPEYGGTGPSIEELCQEWTRFIMESEELLHKLSINSG